MVLILLNRNRHNLAYSVDETLLQSLCTLKLTYKALVVPLMPHRVAQKCNFVILQITLDVNRKRSKLRAVSLP